MAGFELFERGDAEQTHRARELGAEDLDGAVDTLASAGHEAVEVGATDEREPSAEGNRGHDVRPRHDAGVEQDLGVLADLAHDLWQQMEWDRRTVELPATVIGEQDAVDTHRRKRAGVIQVLHALDDELAWPLLLDPGEILKGHRGIEHGVEQFGDRARPAVEGGEGERFGGEEVDPPGRARNRVDDRLRRERGWNRHTVAGIPESRASDGNVDRDEQRVEAGFRGAIDERHRAFAVLPHVQLEPVSAVRVRGLYVLDRGRSHG